MVRAPRILRLRRRAQQIFFDLPQSLECVIELQCLSEKKRAKWLSRT
jgi:hypothetical protein